MLPNVPGFVSIENALKSDTTYTTDIDSEVLQTVLNYKNIIRVGDWVIKVDKNNERVLVLHASKIQYYGDLVNNNLNNPNIWMFRTEDEVFELLKMGFRTSLTESELERWGIICRNKCGRAENSNGDNINLTPLTTRGSVQARYIRYGIYFELFVRNAVFERTYGIVPPTGANFYARYQFNYSYESCRKSRSNVTVIEDSRLLGRFRRVPSIWTGVTCASNSRQDCGDYAYYYKYIIYGEMTGLRKYKVNANTTRFSTDFGFANVNIFANISCGY